MPMSLTGRPANFRSYRDRHQSAANPNLASAATLTVLLADADILARTVIADYLRSHRCGVVEAASAREVFKILRTDIKIDAVLANSSLLKVDVGFCLAEEIRRNRPEIQLLLVSNAAEAADRSSEFCHAGSQLTPSTGPGRRAAPAAPAA